MSRCWDMNVQSDRTFKKFNERPEKGIISSCDSNTHHSNSLIIKPPKDIYKWDPANWSTAKTVHYKRFLVESVNLPEIRFFLSKGSDPENGRKFEVSQIFLKMTYNV